MHGLNAVFIDDNVIEDKWAFILQFLPTKTYPQVAEFGLWYFFSEYHNYDTWTENENKTFMEAFEIYGNNFVEINNYLPARSLMNVHAHAIETLPAFSYKKDMSCYENLNWGNIMENEVKKELFSPLEPMQFTEVFNRLMCKHCKTSTNSNLEIEPVDISDTEVIDHVMADDNLEFLFDTLFD